MTPVIDFFALSGFEAPPFSSSRQRGFIPEALSQRAANLLRSSV